MVDDFRGEAGLIVLDQCDFVFSWDIGGGDDREFAPRNAVAEANAADAPSRDAAAHSHAMQHFRKGEVVHVPGAARHFFPSLFSDDGMPKEFFFHILPHLRSARPPWRTGATKSPDSSKKKSRASQMIP